MPEVVNRERPGDIYRLMGAVLADMGAVGKDRQVPQAAGGYRFRGIDDFLNAVHGVFAKHGVFVVPEVLHINREDRVAKGGAALIYTMLTVRHRFYAPDGSWIEGTSVGEGMDGGDKSANKAMSAALKYMLIEAFAVPTEDGMKDSEDDDHEVQPGTRRTPKHPAHDGEITVEVLEAEADKRGLTTAQLMIRARKLQPQMRSLGDLTQAERSVLMSQMGGDAKETRTVTGDDGTGETEKTRDEDFSEMTTEYLRHLKKLCRDRHDEREKIAELMREAGVTTWKQVPPHVFDAYVRRIAAMPDNGATGSLTDEEKAAALEAERREAAKEGT